MRESELMRIPFKSQFWVVGQLPHFDQETIKAEPQLWRADRSFAMQNGGPITRAFIEALGWPSLILDSRVHMLMPRMYPCIPGWHLDDAPRTRPDGQPDHVTPVYKSEHCAAVLGDASLTVFALGDLELEDVPIGGGVVYQEWHFAIEKLVEQGTLRAQAIKEGQLVKFGWGSFHRGASASKRGWRMFIRATRQTQIPARNEIRNQTQVYLTEPFTGW